MTLHNIVNGQIIEMTPDEEKETLERWALAEKEMEARKNHYSINRKYPTIPDQLDMIWHAMDKGILPKDDQFYPSIKAAKDLHPKPEGS